MRQLIFKRIMAGLAVIAMTFAMSTGTIVSTTHCQDLSSPGNGDVEVTTNVAEYYNVSLPLLINVAGKDNGDGTTTFECSDNGADKAFTVLARGNIRPGYAVNVAVPANITLSDTGNPSNNFTLDVGYKTGDSVAPVTLKWLPRGTVVSQEYDSSNNTASSALPSTGAASTLKLGVKGTVSTPVAATYEGTMRFTISIDPTTP